LSDKAVEEGQQTAAQFLMLKKRLDALLSLLQKVKNDKKALETLVRSLETPSPLLSEAKTKARQLARLQDAKKHLQGLSKVYDLT
jgi:DNA repair exonuclease SbcCD ATPase subunit